LLYILGCIDGLKVHGMLGYISWKVHTGIQGVNKVGIVIWSIIGIERVRRARDSGGLRLYKGWNGRYPVGQGRMAGIWD